MSQIRLLIVDDHEVVRLGLRTLLEDEADLLVVAEAGTVEEALREVERYRPQVAVVDINLPGRSGLDACREIRRRFADTRVVVLTSFADDSFIAQALRAGAAGYVLKQVGSDELIRAVRVAARGETALDPQTAARVVARLNELEIKADEDVVRHLSARERDVMRLAAAGKTNKEIGAALGLSDITVRNYLSGVLDKLKLNNRVELATFAIKHRLADRPPE